MKDCRDQDTPRVNSQKHVTRTWIDVFREIGEIFSVDIYKEIGEIFSRSYGVCSNQGDRYSWRRQIPDP